MIMTLRVAAYARVSTDKEDQINSLANQREYFESYIRSHNEWEYAGVYFDEGVTGTQTKNRAGFKTMIDNCRLGHIDLVLTKEVSRFARNTVDALKYTRMLREYNVGVLFINDNIDTRDNDGEFRLSIMASVAQEESRKISERVKWGQRRAMENGVVFGNNSIFGYDISNGILTVNRSEAEVIKHIFNKYLNEGKGTHVISRELYEENIKPPEQKNDFWSSTMILRILRNEKYVGDLMQKKYITSDYITHKKTINSGEKIFIPNHHEAIIDRTTWNRTQEELKRRSTGKVGEKKYSNRYWCSGKITCGDCGTGFVIRRSKKKSGVYMAWGCHERVRHGRKKTDSRGNTAGCNMRMLNNKSLTECMCFIIKQLEDVCISAAKEVTAEIISFGSGEREEMIRNLKEQAENIENKRLRMLDWYFAEKISEDEMKCFSERYEREIEQINARLEHQRNTQYNGHDYAENADSIEDILRNQTVYSKNVYGELLDKITVYDNYILIKLKYVDFIFKIKYSTYGCKDNYTTVIEQCDIVSA